MLCKGRWAANLFHGIQGESIPLEEVLSLRNAVVEAEDLRRPVNLSDQVILFDKLAGLLQKGMSEQCWLH